MTRSATHTRNTTRGREHASRQDLARTAQRSEHTPLTAGKADGTAVRTGTQPRVFLLHSIVSPYRLPLFEVMEERYRVEAFFLKDKTSDRKWDTRLDGYSFRRTVLPCVMLGPFFGNWNLPAVLCREKPDIYLIGECPEMVFSTWMTVIAAKVRRKPIVLWSETIADHVTYFPSLYKSRNPLAPTLQWCLRTAMRVYRKTLYAMPDHFVGFSADAKRFLLSYHVASNRIETAPQVMPREQLAKPSGVKRPVALRNKVVLLSLGYLNRHKGLYDLIDAFRALPPAVRAKAVLVIAGSGPDETAITAHAQHAPDILFTGYVDGAKKADSYAHADFFVFPTHHDAWGLVINEAMHYGLPVIASTSAGGAEIITDGTNGYVVPTGDVPALSNRMARLITNSGLRTRMGARNAQRAEVTDPRAGAAPFLRALDAVQRKQETRRDTHA